MKAIKQTQTRDILDAYNREDISYSRMNEMFNELADEYAIEVLEFYHNSLFMIALKDGEAKRILNYIKKEKGL